MIEYYDCGEDPEYLSHQDVSEAVQAWADDLDPDTPLPETVTVYHYQRERITGTSNRAEWILETLLERLDEEYGSPDEATEPTTAQRFIVQGLVHAFEATYKVWRCKRVGSHEAKVRDYVAEA